MVVAEEIARIQNAKADIRQAIIDKGVSVPSNLTIDGYAACIAAIEGKSKFLGFTVVGGGGNGSSSRYSCGSGGGGGAVCHRDLYPINTSTISVTVGGIAQASCLHDNEAGSDIMVARGGCNASGLNGGASGSGCSGGGYSCCCAGGGGGGAGGNGGGGSGCAGGNGGGGLCGFGGGGAGSGRSSNGTATDGGGAASSNATNYGGGGGGGGNTYNNGQGCQGVVFIFYPTDGSYGINSSSGGQCCYTCNGCCIHRFTSSGTFTIID